jgi:transcriptional regulator
MYVPKLYREEDREQILEFLNRNNFPALVSHNGQGLVATHLPVEIHAEGDEKLTVYGHMSRANPQWKSFGDQEVLLIFQGAHTYISPRWYDHVNVPTWNYLMVHVYGKARVIGGEELHAVLGRLVERHEAASSYRLENLPADFVAKEINGVAGFAVDVTRIDAGYKLSQNRNDRDHANIIGELEKRADDASHEVAQAMRRASRPS